MRLDEIDPEWSGKEAEGERGWMSVSTMGRDTDPEVDPDDKSVFDWVKESNLEKVQLCLAEMSQAQCNEKDETGLGLIHWAADRGSGDIVQSLVGRGADVNLSDEVAHQCFVYVLCSTSNDHDVAITTMKPNVKMNSTLWFALKELQNAT